MGVLCVRTDNSSVSSRTQFSEHMWVADWFSFPPPCQIKVLDGGAGRCVCEIEVTQDLTNRTGMLHGGATSTLVDVVTTAALMSTEKGVPGVSVDLNIS